MNVRYNLSGVGDISQDELKQINSELEVIVAKDIPHDKRRMALLENQTVRVRIVDVHNYLHIKNPTIFTYFVRDYGFDEECILWIARDAKVLLRARALTEVYPGVPATRPIESDSFVPVPNRVYGMGLLEMLENFQDAMQA
ncbi:MAG: hypothetical protein AAB922_05005, partial [Patescibacteria group bacterium]